MIKEIREVGQRGVIFQYEDQNLVYLIKGDVRLYLCDTHLGPESMEIVKNYISESGLTNKELIIFNSHSDYDHNWGNCSFQNNLIVAQARNLFRFKMTGEYNLEMKSRFKKGRVKLVYPNLLFKDKLYFSDDEIEFIYLPGHTLDSAICLDHKDSIIYAGDLVEAPIPMILWQDLKTYIQSLKTLKAYPVDRYIASHSGIVEEKLIDKNIEYIQSLINEESLDYEDDGLNRVHEFNQKNLLIQNFIKEAQDKFGEGFDFKEFKKGFWQELDVDYGDLTDEFNFILATNQEKLQKAFESYLLN